MDPEEHKAITATAAHATEATSLESAGGHVVPAKILLTTCATLLILTWLTVAASWLDVGQLNIVIALGIACVKATVVALYFMHLRWDRPFNRLVIVSALVFVILFIGLCVLDTQSYRVDLHPGDSSAVRERLGPPAAP